MPGPATTEEPQGSDSLIIQDYKSGVGDWDSLSEPGQATPRNIMPKLSWSDLCSGNSDRRESRRRLIVRSHRRHEIQKLSDRPVVRLSSCQNGLRSVEWLFCLSIMFEHMSIAQVRVNVSLELLTVNGSPKRKEEEKKK
jgi:hypothetical protein